jgi:hypothetical protein
MVQLHEQADPRLCHARQEPYPPQWAGSVQPLPPQFLAGREQLGLAGEGAALEDRDVVGDVECWGVNPQRPAQPPPRGVQELAETRKRLEPAADLLADGLDRQTAVRFEQPGAIEDAKRPGCPGASRNLPTRPCSDPAHPSVP